MALAHYDDTYWFPNGTLAANIPARVFPEESNTFASLYADATATTPLPNPLTTTDTGHLTFWAEAGFYWIHIDAESIRVGVGVSDGGVTPPEVDAAIAAHAADTTDVHGIADTAVLETVSGSQAKADAARQAAVTTAAADATTKADNARQAAVNTASSALNAHNVDTTNVHGVADMTALETDAGAQAKADAAEAAAEGTAAAALSAHATDTTDVHGIPDTSLIPTSGQIDAVQAELDTHEAATTAVHGIADTAALETLAGAQAKADAAEAAAEQAADAALATHAADTTAVHGIADTAALETLAGAQAKADAAQSAAADALNVHAADTTDVHGIPDTSLIPSSAQIDAVQAELDTHEAATANVHGITDTAALETQTGAQAKVDTHNADTTNVHGIADTAQIPTGAQIDAVQTDLATHEAATANVHGIPDTSALETTTGAQAKADAARDAAIADAADTYLNRLTGGTVTGPIYNVAATTDAPTYAAQVAGEVYDRFRVQADGTLNWGPGTADRDVSLRRSAPSELTLDDALNIALTLGVTGDATISGILHLAQVIQQYLATPTSDAVDLRVVGDTQPRFYQQADGDMYWGPGGTTPLDTSLRREAADQLYTDDHFTVAQNLVVGGGAAVADTLTVQNSSLDVNGVTAASGFTVQSQSQRQKSGIRFAAIAITSNNEIPTQANGNMSPDITIATLDPAWRPPFDMYLGASSGIGHGSVRVQGDGVIQLLTWLPSTPVYAGNTIRFTYCYFA